MKWTLLLLLGLLLAAAGPAPPAGRVTLTPLSKAAYLAARKNCSTAKPRVTFPLRKQHGRLVIPTAKGPRIFTDSQLTEDNPDWEKFTYEGYLPQAECHLILHNHYEWSRVILLTKSGQQLVLQDDPVFSPGFAHFVGISGGLEYGANENYIRLYELKNHGWKPVWHLTPKTWEPADIYWASDSTLLLQKRQWPSERRTYARLTVKH